MQDIQEIKKESEQFLQHSPFAIPVSSFEQMVKKYLQREHLTDDIDFYEEQGGDKWLKEGLKTDFHQGIDSQSIPMREQVYGTNRKQERRMRTFWEFATEAFDDFILRVLVVAGIVSIIINVIVEKEERSTAWIEGFAILIAVALVVFVTAWNDLKQEKEFQKLNKRAEAGKVVSVIRDGVENKKTNLQEVLVGDLMLLKGGIEVPGDGIVIEANQINIDESSMTGETQTMKKNILDYSLQKKAQLIKEDRLKEHHDVPSMIILAGTKMLSGSGKMIIINVGENSAIGKIEKILKSGEAEITPLQAKLEKIARDIGMFGFVSAILIFLVLAIRLIVEEAENGWTASAGDYLQEFLEYFLISIAILVVAIPEGLPLAVTLSLAFSVNKMAEDKNLVRKIAACETMGGANIICSDKTGTLTKNEMYWTHFWSGKERNIYDATKETCEDFKNFTNDKTQELFLNTVLLNSIEDPAQKVGNPTELALLRYFHLQGIDVPEYRKKHNIVHKAPFSSDRKRMSTIVKVGDHEFVFMKGASEYMLQISNKFLDLQTGQTVNLDASLKREVEQSILHMAQQSLRTIGLCYKVVQSTSLELESPDERGIFEYETDGFVMLGIAGIKDIIRSTVPDSIRKCQMAGIDIKMVTGDNKITARAIAQEIGLINDKNRDRALVMEGPEFLRLIGGVVCSNHGEKKPKKCDCVNNEFDLEKPENKGKKVRKDTIQNPHKFDEIWKDLIVLARSRPEDKYALVVGLRERNNVVAVTGDGTNDAPALKRADVGFAMNIAGTEVAKQAADILIMDDNFTSIVKAVMWGRNIYDSIRKFLQFQLTVNVVAVVTTFVSACVLKEAIFSPVQMLWINLIMDTLAALALATEPPTEKLLERQPYKKNEYIVNPLMVKHILGQSVLQSIIIFVLVFIGEDFLIDPIGKRQLQDGSDKLIIHGREQDGFDRDDHDNEYSVHYTYLFNIFVFLQLFNFLNCRILDDSINVFRNILKSNYFIAIWIIIIFLQIIFLTFLGKAIRVVTWGLDPVGWAISIGIGTISLVTGFILKFIPLEKILPGGGAKEITREQLNRLSTMNLRKKHDKKFFKNQSGLSIGSQDRR